MAAGAQVLGRLDAHLGLLLRRLSNRLQAGWPPFRILDTILPTGCKAAFIAGAALPTERGVDDGVRREWTW